eukprot:TRINITY_DN66350_c0_g1_i1.p1 TRINITY_DN66350_c0_g1~~TRINITY_DN66350_c0_g1_i1.p1  ORF type:complete len:187 (-),score=24.94 TRINITY_DN66350_c0_g1_i1:217-777(-)
MSICAAMLKVATVLLFAYADAACSDTCSGGKAKIPVDFNNETCTALLIKNFAHKDHTCFGSGPVFRSICFAHALKGDHAELCCPRKQDTQMGSRCASGCSHLCVPMLELAPYLAGGPSTQIRLKEECYSREMGSTCRFRPSNSCRESFQHGPQFTSAVADANLTWRCKEEAIKAEMSNAAAFLSKP